MHEIDPRVLSQEKSTMTCACGAVFTVTVSRQAGCDRLQTFPCPACARLHAAKTCLPPSLALITVPAAFAASRPAA